jgi:hypothetical protein
MISRVGVFGEEPTATGMVVRGLARFARSNSPWIPLKPEALKPRCHPSLCVLWSYAPPPWETEEALKLPRSEIPATRPSVTVTIDTEDHARFFSGLN